MRWKGSTLMDSWKREKEVKRYRLRGQRKHMWRKGEKSEENKGN